METTSQYVLSGNYFTHRYIYALSVFAKSLSSDVGLVYEDREHNLKNPVVLFDLTPIKVGQSVKIICYNEDFQTALSDLGKVRVFIEDDYRRTD